MGSWRCGWVVLGSVFAVFGCDSSPSENDVPGDVAGDSGDGDAGVEEVLGDEASDADEEADAGEAEADVPPELVWGACDTTDWPAGYPLPASGVECTTIDVPLDHDNPEGPTVPLNVGIHRSRSFPTGLAVFNLAGGPGGASVAQSGIIPRVMPALRASHDMVYVDQRGTGGSGYMGCPAGYPETRDEWIACADAHRDRDLDHYLTVDAAHDLDDVRRRLGYDRIHLRGGSYGTRLGLEYMRQHAEAVTAAVLDGLAPPDVDLFGESIPMVDHGVDLLVADCEADGACLAVSPDVRGDLLARREALRADPRPISIDGYADFEDEEVYVMFLGAFLYDAGWRFEIPRAVHQAALGDNTLWNLMLSEASGYSITDRAKSGTPGRTRAPFRWAPRRPRGLAQDYVAPGLFVTVVCAEWLPNSGGVDALREIAAGVTWDPGPYVGLAEACSAWDVAPIAADLRQPVSSAIPTLLLNGEIDLNTPAEWGPHAAATLPGGTNLVVPYATHSAIRVPCAAGIAARFIMAEGRIGDVDTSCLDSIAAPSW